VEESQVGVQPMKRAKIDLGGPSRIIRNAFMAKDREDQLRLMIEQDADPRIQLGVKGDQRK